RLGRARFKSTSASSTRRSTRRTIPDLGSPPGHPAPNTRFASSSRSLTHPGRGAPSPLPRFFGGMPLQLAELKPIRTVLSNGLRLAAVPMPHMHRSVLEAQIRVGSRFESPAENGISHFLEHMLYRGTPRYPSAHDQALAFETLGGTLLAAT